MTPEFFIHPPVKDLKGSNEFYTKLRCVSKHNAFKHVNIAEQACRFIYLKNADHARMNQHSFSVPDSYQCKIVFINKLPQL